jgi:hypothetical protein
MGNKNAAYPSYSPISTPLHINYYSVQEINGYRRVLCTYPSLLCIYVTMQFMYKLQTESLWK